MVYRLQILVKIRLSQNIVSIVLRSGAFFIFFSASSLPYHYERGFALSLWSGLGKLALEYPQELAFSPEPLFADVVSRYPALAGKFPRWFTGNYSTGVFIPAGRAPEVLAWVEGKVAAFTKGDRQRFKGLLRVLRAAVQKELAYWEATDVVIPMTNQSVGDSKLMTAGFLGNEQGTSGPQVEQAPIEGRFNRFNWKLIDHWLVSGDMKPFGTCFWDLSVWPPRLAHTLPAYVKSVARSRDGRWLLLSETDPAAKKPYVFRPRIFSDLGRPADEELPQIDGSEIGFVGNIPIIFHTKLLLKPGEKQRLPHWFFDGSWQPAPGLPDLSGKPKTGVVQLADGGNVVIWGEDGYEWNGERFERTFALFLKPSHDDWTWAPTGTDGSGFFYLSLRSLYATHRIFRGRKVKPRVTGWNIRSVGRGPSGSLLLRLGDNDDGDVAKLFFLAERTYIHIEPEMFDDGDYEFIYWSETADRFIVARGGKFLSVPTSAVLSLPRHSLPERQDDPQTD